MEDGTDRVIDLETGDIYVWNTEQMQYVKEEQPIEEPVISSEGVIENEPIVSPVEDNIELPLQSDSVYALEEKVTGLEEDVQTLTSEVMALRTAVSDYNLGTSNLTIFQGIVEKLPYGKHYVYWRDGEYRYCLAVGDLTVSGSTFVSEQPVIIYTYERISSNYNSNYHWSVTTDDVFSLACESMLVYSDIGDYPAISGKELNKYEAVTAYCALGIVLFALFDRLRDSCLRR